MNPTPEIHSFNEVRLSIDEGPIEQQSIRWLEADPELRQHIELINRCFEVMHTLLLLNKQWSEDEFTIIRLGVRLLNAAGSGSKCARSGYYQPAFAMTRDLIETSFLLDYFKLHPDKIRLWRESNSKTRYDKFKPSGLRKALASAESFKAPRQEIYAWYCENATHPSPDGIELISTLDGLRVGPFSDLERLTLFMHDLAWRFSAATMTFAKHLAEHSVETFAIQMQFFRALRDWYIIYVPELCPGLSDEIARVESTLEP
jgi:hypothetical protein